MKNKWLDRTIITSPIRYTLCTTKEMFSSQLKKLRILDSKEFISHGSDSCVHYFRCTDGNDLAIVNINIEDEDIEITYAMIAHEAMHIWQYILESMGEEKPSDEFEAYSIQHLCGNLFMEYKRQLETHNKNLDDIRE